MRALLIACIAVFVGCQLQEPIPFPIDPNYPEDDAVDGASSPGGRACRALRAWGCAEGYRDARTKRTCFQRITHEAELMKIPYECVAGARSADAVRGCGTKDTLRFRCRMPSVDDPADGGS